ncbi:MAG: RsmE family RNA methyltransferase [Victivallaceae bacterium]|nr:RsmE family RNA methyltransferase [Victivallaceae bacterium]
MHRFFVENIAPSGGEQELPRAEAEHLFRTLRAREGDTVGLLDGRGGRAVARVESGRRLVVESCEVVAMPSSGLRLYCAAPRRLKFDTLLKQCAELGVISITPVNFTRSVAQPVSGERHMALLREGCKQSGNPFLPEITPAVDFEELPALLAANRVDAYFGSVAPAVSRDEPVGGDLGWVVGPEGGFTPEEERTLLASGIKPLNLGPWVLRLETAAVAGLAVLRRQLMRGDV